MADLQRTPYRRGATNRRAELRLKAEVHEERVSRRQDVLAKARRQRLTEHDLARAEAQDKSADAITEAIRAAAALAPGSNLKELEHIRLAFGYEAGDIPLRV
eukprot:jgi/Ulvmu1/10254/UM060_0055.1